MLPDLGFRLPGVEEVLLGSSFYVEGGAQEAEGGGTWAAWGDVAATRFEGDANGLALDGDVVTGTLGLDRQWRALLVGIALSRSSGEGAYGTGAGTIASTLTSVHPYVRVRLADRAQLWGAAGWGRGGLEITPESGTVLEADLTNRMGALGRWSASTIPEQVIHANSGLCLIVTTEWMTSLQDFRGITVQSG